MQKNFYFFIVLMFCFVFSVCAAEEQITLTTFYPSPNGVYDKLGVNKLAVDVNGVAVASEFAAMQNGDAHVGRSLIVGAGGGSGFAYDEGALPADGDVLIKGDVGIGTTAPNSSARLQIDSTTGGFLVPRMTTIQRNAISSPTEGLVIYNTDFHEMEYYNGSIWRAVGPANLLLGTLSKNGIFLFSGVIMTQDVTGWTISGSGICGGLCSSLLAGTWGMGVDRNGNGVTGPQCTNVAASTNCNFESGKYLIEWGGTIKVDGDTDTDRNRCITAQLMGDSGLGVWETRDTTDTLFDTDPAAGVYTSYDVRQMVTIVENVGNWTRFKIRMVKRGILTQGQFENAYINVYWIS